MGGNIKPFGWIALFRDGHTIEQSAASEPLAFHSLVKYLYGTPEDPKKHYLLWFKISDGDIDYVVSFDRDGDAYIDTPDGRCFMTEMKIRSAHLLYQHNKIARTFHIGFGGVNTAGQIDGKCLTIYPDGSYETLSELPIDYAMIKIENVKEKVYGGNSSLARG